MDRLFIPFAVLICGILLSATGSLTAQPGVRLGAPDSVSFGKLNALSPSEASVAVSAIATPMVVSISTPIGKMDDLRLRYLEEYLKQYGGGRFDSEKYRGRSIGSGVIVSENGYILTNNHVVDGAYEDSILVTLQDGRSMYATLIGQDERTDLALLRIYADGLDAAKFAESQDINIGEWVLAVGNPLGLKSTVTFGIISALNREPEYRTEDEYAVSSYVQTDAAINPGNSGGGLFNLRGELIGINTAIWSSNGYYQGYGFAMPVNIAEAVAYDLVVDGKLDRGFLGITAREVDDSVAARLFLEDTDGAVIDHVEKGSPAERAGLQIDDVVLMVNDRKVETLQRLKSILAVFVVDEELKLTIQRDGAEKTMTVKLGRDPYENAPENEFGDPVGGLGIGVRPLAPGEASELGMPGTNGLVIDEIQPHGTASLARLFEGDVLLRLNDERVFSMEGLADYLAPRKAGEAVMFTVWRRGKEVIRTAIMQPKR